MSDVESLLADTLRECPALTEFAGKGQLASGRADVQLSIRDGEAYVNLYTAGDGGIVVVGYSSGVEFEDGAYCGDVDEAHAAVNRLARHTECEVLWDVFNTLGSD